MLVVGVIVFSLVGLSLGMAGFGAYLFYRECRRSLRDE